MRQQESIHIFDSEQEIRKRSKLLNRILIVNLILSSCGFWKLYSFYNSQASCQIQGWLRYFSLVTDFLMAGSIFIFLLIRKSYKTRNYFLFVLVSNLQIVCRFIYLNQIILGLYDTMKGNQTKCWISSKNMMWQLGQTIVEIITYFTVARITAFKFSHHVGFMQKKSQILGWKA